MHIQSFFDKDTATFTHVVSDQKTKTAIVIDSVLNYDQFSGHVTTTSADEVIAYISDHNLKLEWILETHIHADHITAAKYLKKKLGGRTGIGSGIKNVLETWVPIFNTEKDTPKDGSQFDKIFEDNASFSFGNIDVIVLHTPGHTPACVSYYIPKENLVFVGDTIFMPDLGTARTDFPGGSPTALYRSIQKILSLPLDTRIYGCHDYPPIGREISYVSTVSEQKKNNIIVNDTISEKDYVEIRRNKDYNKPVPKLLFPAIQVNLRAGDFGVPETNGGYYLKIPVDGIIF